MTKHGAQEYTAQAFGARAREALEAIAKELRQQHLPEPNQKWVAEQVQRYDPSVDQGGVSRWMNGHMIPREPRRVAALARALRVEPGWLLFGDEGCAKVGAAAGADADILSEGPPGLAPGSGEGKRSGRRRRASGR